jgi:hypothetical protein
MYLLQKTFRVYSLFFFFREKRKRLLMIYSFSKLILNRMSSFEPIVIVFESPKSISSANLKLSVLILFAFT